MKSVIVNLKWVNLKWINDPKKTFKDRKKTFAYALQKLMYWRNLKCSMKMWNPASANLTFDFIKMELYHEDIIVECFDFFFVKAILQNRSDYLWGVFLCLVSQIEYLLFWYGWARPTPETETFTECCSRKNCSEKFHKFYRKEHVMKPFLDKLQPVSLPSKNPIVGILL